MARTYWLQDDSVQQKLPKEPAVCQLTDSASVATTHKIWCAVQVSLACTVVDVNLALNMNRQAFDRQKKPSSINFLHSQNDSQVLSAVNTVKDTWTYTVYLKTHHTQVLISFGFHCQLHTHPHTLSFLRHGCTWHTHFQHSTVIGATHSPINSLPLLKHIHWRTQRCLALSFGQS